MNSPVIFYPASALINCITSLALGYFVFRQDRKDRLYITYALFCLSVSIWSIFYFLWQISNTAEQALFYSRCLMLGAIFIPFFYFHHVTELLHMSQKYRLHLLVGYFSAVAALTICFTPAFVSQVSPSAGFKFWPISGSLFGPFLVFWFCYVSLGIYLLIKEFVSSHGHRRNQIKCVLVATIIGWVGGATNYPLWFGLNIPPIGNILVSVYLSIVAYAIAKHKLMDIELIVRRTAVFAGLFVFVYGIFTLVTVASQGFLSEALPWGRQAALLVTVAIITFSLRPLETLLTDSTEKFLFQKKYDYRQLLKTFADEILTILDLQKLLDQTVLQLQKIMKLENASILLHQKAEKSYTIVASAGFREKDVVFAESDLLITMLREGHHPIQKDKASEKVDGDGRLREDFRRIKAQLCLPIMLHDELIGVLALGMKKSGEDYTPEDVDILSTLARTEAIAISNAQLFDELSKTQAEAAQREKMAVIGTLAAGINHEICNPLGIVRGQCEMFLLNMRDGLYKDKTPEELIQISSDIMTKVIKETDRATGITKKLSSFAKPSKKHESEDVSVRREADEILALLGHDLKLSNIEFRFELPTDFPDILVDRKQFQEVLFNIIRNAAQAMDKKKGVISIGGFVEHDMAAVRISDNGMGIPKEKIHQIFNPFYTTKAPGKGTGLGLFIVKQVVERNKGSIDVESVEGEGTTFTLRFPLAAKLAAA